MLKDGYDNVLFREGRIVLVTDLDFMGVRPRVDDLALTLYYANSTLSGDQLSDARVHRLRGLVDAYDNGLTVPLTGASGPRSRWRWRGRRCASSA